MKLLRRIVFCFPPLLLGCLAATVGAQDRPNAEGRSIYIRECAICHGVDLKGRDADWRPDSIFVPPLDFSGKAWRLTDQELREMFRSGSHAAEMRFSNLTMPPFAGRLSEADMAALLAYLKEQWTAAERGHQAEETRRAALPREAAAQLGAQLYGAKCAICHGANMEGRTDRIGPPGQQRDVRIPALRHDIFAQALSDARLRAIIDEGESHHPIPRSDYRMPGFLLGEEEADALVQYLRLVWSGRAP